MLKVDDSMVSDPVHSSGEPGVRAAPPIREWCEQCAVPGRRPPLSDEAAVLIAAGHLQPAARAILVRRISLVLPIPRPVGGYADLRLLQRAIGQLEYQLASTMVPGVVAAVLRGRLGSLTRRRDDAHKTVVGGKGVFANGTRAIRRERRENVYLDIDDRERLFAGLLYTPTPDANSSGMMRRAGSAAVERIADAVGQVANRSGRKQVGQWAQQMSDTTPQTRAPSTPAGAVGFVDGYETLLYVAGHYYDRIMVNPAWRSDHFQAQRTQVNLHAELAEIAADVVALRAVRIDIDTARGNGGFDRGFAEQLDRRERALRPVWSELIDRVQAMAEVAHVVESAAVELRLLAEYDKATTLDDRIDALIARSGDREISVDNTRRLTEQVRSREEHLKIYRDVLQGNIARIAPAAAHPLPARYQPDPPPQPEERWS